MSYIMSFLLIYHRAVLTFPPIPNVKLDRTPHLIILRMPPPFVQLGSCNPWTYPPISFMTKIPSSSPSNLFMLKP